MKAIEGGEVLVSPKALISTRKAMNLRIQGVPAYTPVMTTETVVYACRGFQHTWGSPQPSQLKKPDRIASVLSIELRYWKHRGVGGQNPELACRNQA